MRTSRWLALIAGLLVACAGSGSRVPASLERLWSQYEKLPRHRALALAGDPSRLWVAGAAGGHETEGGAREAALDECAARRQERRIQAPCRLYAVGDEIVW